MVPEPNANVEVGVAYQFMVYVDVTLSVVVLPLKMLWFKILVVFVGDTGKKHWPSFKIKTSPVPKALNVKLLGLGSKSTMPL